MAKHRRQENPDDQDNTSANITSNQKEHVAKHERHANSCIKCNFETKTKGKLTNHVVKHKSQKSYKDKSKTSANVTSNP